MMKIHTIHGIHRKRAGWLVALAKGLVERGHDARPFVYGYTFTFTAFVVSWFAARKLARETEPGDAYIDHSNGGRVSHWAMTKFGARPGLIVHISSALNRSNEPPAGIVCQVWILSTPHDSVVKKIRWWPGAWGDMGAVGYKPKKGHQPDPRIRNVICNKIAGHSSWGGDLPWLINFCDQAIRLRGKPNWRFVPVHDAQMVGADG